MHETKNINQATDINIDIDIDLDIDDKIKVNQPSLVTKIAKFTYN